MGAILNLELLGCAVLKRPPGAPKLKRVRRKAPPNDEGWDLPTFAPVAGDLVASLARGDLSQEAYPFVNPPVEAGAAARAAGAAVPGRSVRSSASAAAGGSGAGTARSARSAGATWAKKGGGGGGPESGGGGGLGGGLAELRLAQPRGRRLVVFVLGPVSFNEVRVAHDLAHSLGRDVFLGGTSVASSEEARAWGWHWQGGTVPRPARAHGAAPRPPPR